MCCRSTAPRLDTEAALYVLERGLFILNDKGEWIREIPEEHGRVTVTLGDHGFSAALWPSISTYSQHSGKRIAASVMFEILARYSEKVGGEVIQRGTVAGCRPSGVATGDIIIADYPRLPLLWPHVCAGFQSVLLGSPTSDTVD